MEAHHGPGRALDAKNHDPDKLGARSAQTTSSNAWQKAGIGVLRDGDQNGGAMPGLGSGPGARGVAVTGRDPHN